MRDEQDLFETLRTIKNKPNSTQRELAEELGFSLGKLNYCLRALKDKGFVKIENFAKNPNKLNPAYIVFDNYEKILKWNRSLRFALAVCTLKNKFINEI